MSINEQLINEQYTSSPSGLNTTQRASEPSTIGSFCALLSNAFQTRIVPSQDEETRFDEPGLGEKLILT